MVLWDFATRQYRPYSEMPINREWLTKETIPVLEARLRSYADRVLDGRHLMVQPDGVLPPDPDA